MNRVEISRRAPAVRTEASVWTWTWTWARMVVVAGLALSSWGCGSSRATCDLGDVIRRRAGAGAIDCGQVATGASSTATDQCIADQTARAAPFYARYDVQGIDSHVALGAVRDAAGRSAVLLWDSDPSGGSNVGAQIGEMACGGDPPIRTTLTNPDSFVPVFCTSVVSTATICAG